MFIMFLIPQIWKSGCPADWEAFVHILNGRSIIWSTARREVPIKSFQAYQIMQRGHKDKFKFYQQFVSVKLQSSIFGSLSNTSMRIWSTYSPGRSVLKIHFFIESGPKMIQFKIHSKQNPEYSFKKIFIQSSPEYSIELFIHKKWGKLFKIPT